MKKIFAYLTLGFTTLTTYAATPLWMRDIQISPDGTEIVFCYKGDIYKVSAKGGTATQLTTQESYESSPVWSPDGKQIAFASDRQGNFDVFVMPSDGGAAQRLTTNSAGEIPSAFTPDGKYILFSAAIQDPAGSALFPSPAMTELYKVPATGGRTEQVLGTPAEALCFDKTGDMFFYQDQKGFEDQWRKHHTSSITRDIWMYDCRTEKHTNLTRHAGEDRNPVLSPDGQTLYFLSERNGGSFNVYSLQPAHPEAVKAVSSFKTHPVRFLSISGNGCCHNAVAVINAFAKVYGLIGRVVMVCQVSRSMCYGYIVDAVIVQHLQSHIGSRHSVAGGDFRIFLEFTLQVHLYQPTDHSHPDKDNPLHAYHSCSHNFLLLIINK